MSALFILIGISILVAGGFLTAFLWSVKNGQYDDDYTPSVRMLFDDEKTPSETNISKEQLASKQQPTGNQQYAINSKPLAINSKK